MKANKILVIDVEATCWDGFPPKDEVQEIIEIGVIPVDIVNMQIGKGESIYVKPNNSIVSTYCTELTGITLKKLQHEGIDYKDAVRVLTEKYDSRNCPMTSWGEFDKNMFWRGTDLYECDYPFHISHFNIKYAFSMWQRVTKLYGLKGALKRLNFEFKGTQHCGHDDAYNTAVIFVEMLKSFDKIQNSVRRTHV